jgi:hypothetical protein
METTVSYHQNQKGCFGNGKMEKSKLGNNRLYISGQHIVDIGDYTILEVTAENIGEIL